MSYKKHESFSNSHAFFDYLEELLDPTTDDVGNKRRHAGKLFELFTRDWHMSKGNYAEIYDANNFKSIPNHIVDNINGWEILKGANSYGIDKICVTRSGKYHIMSDKSILDREDTLSMSKVDKLLALRNNPLVKVEHYIVNTNANEISRYVNVHTDKPLVFTHNEFLPNLWNKEEVEADELFWKNIRRRAKNKPTVATKRGFTPRNQDQQDYVDICVKQIVDMLQKFGYAKGYALAVGAFGKSITDAVIGCLLRPYFNPIYTNSKVPVSVLFYHSSQTINTNGAKYIQMLRDNGIDDFIIVVSGTDVVCSEGRESDISDNFYKCSNAAKVVVDILANIEEGRGVTIITLYHHGNIIAEILRLLRLEIPGFKFWLKHKDETDWPCSTEDTRYAYALDDRTESAITFGSSGTERFSKDPLGYGLNNSTIHGLPLYQYTWAEAENNDLVNKLIIATSGFAMSQFTTWYPEFTKDDGTIDWEKKIQSKTVDNDTYLTAGLLIKMACIAKAMYAYPEIERVMGFSSRVKYSWLFKENWADVCDRVLPKDKLAKTIRNIHIEVMNDDKYNPKAVKKHITAIKRAKSKGRYILLSCFLFNRGYDDAPPKGYTGKWLRHHAGFHLSDRDDVTLAQEIWRFTRKDNAAATNLSYYILPLVENDIDPSKPTWSEETQRMLHAVFRYNKNISENFESLAQGKGSSRAKKSGKSRIWIPDILDPTTLGSFIQTTMYNSRGILHADLKMEAHDWLLQEFIKLEDPENNSNRKLVNENFLKIEKFVPLYQHLKYKREWVPVFFSGKNTKGYPKYVAEHVNNNLAEYYKHIRKQRKFKEEKFVSVRGIVQKCMQGQIADSTGYVTYTDEVRKVWGENISWEFINKAKKLCDSKVIDSNTKKVYEALTLVYQNNPLLVDYATWSQLTLDYLPTLGIDTNKVTVQTIEQKFIRHDFYKVLSKTEWNKFEIIKKNILSAGLSKRNSGKTMSDKQKQKLSKRMSGKNNPNYKHGRCMPTGRTLSESKKRAIMTPKGIFPSKMEAAAAFKISSSGISYRLKNDAKNWYEV